VTPDVNVLVAASRADHVYHAKAEQWLHSALENARTGTALGLLGTVVASYLRLVTHPKVFAQPTPTSDALAFIDALLLQPGVAMLTPQNEWPQLRTLCNKLALRDHDIPDAWIAACVLERQETLASFDRDFVRLLPAKRLVLLEA
jgi:toxin-antitoxin system PIN domain toxin